ncbi:hypothetical protein UB45_17655 [Terrabacter sp. 28]|nr:hypothetical protein UB45_17655 [Terrabacter sp. 28]
MGRTGAVVGKALRIALIVIGVGVAGYLALMILLFHSLQEPYPYLKVSNESGRPLLIEYADSETPPGVVGRRGSLVWGTKGYWMASSSHQCERDRLVARDLQGTVVARREGACSSDTWTITGEGLPPPPLEQRVPVGPDQVEVRLILGAHGTEDPVVAWWRELPQTLSRAGAGGLPSGVAVYGPFVENGQLTMYVQGPSAATVLEFARTGLLRPSPGRVVAYVSAPGQPAPQTGTSVLLEATSRPTNARTR